LGCWISGTDKVRCCRGGPWDLLGTWWKGAEEDNREAGKVGLKAAGALWIRPGQGHESARPSI
jgi:hypothetical protein